MKSLRADSPVNIQPPETCPHDRVYTWLPPLIVNDPDSPRIIANGCCDCGSGWVSGFYRGDRRKITAAWRAVYAAEIGVAV